MSIQTPVADDFAEIAKRWREIQQEKAPVEEKREEEAPKISPAEQDSMYWGLY